MEGKGWKTIDEKPRSESAGFNVTKWLPLIIISAVVLALVIAVFSVLNWQRSVKADGEQWQNNTVAKYQAVQTQLGTCLDNTVMSAQVAQQERQTLKDTLAAVAQARYVDSTGKPVDIGTPQGQTIAIKIIQEAYPSVSPDLYKQLMTVAVGCRNQVAGTQQDLQAYAARFKTWTKGGSFIDGTIRKSFPNDNLKVQGLNGQLTGRAALDFIAEPISTQAASDAMKTKTMPQQTLFPSAAATPTK